MSEYDLNSTRLSDFASAYDYCMVLPCNKDKGLSLESEHIVETLISYRKLDCFTYKSDDRQRVFILIRATPEVLKEFCDRIGLLMLLDKDRLKTACEDPNYEFRPPNISPFYINDDSNISKYAPHEFMYVPYKDDASDQRLFYRSDPTLDHPFSEPVRLKAIPLLVEDIDDRNPDFRIQIGRLTAEKKILAFFPLHNLQKREELKNKLIGYPLKPMPISEIKDYFSEHTALYYQFMDHYTKALLIPTIIGIPLQICVWIYNDYSAQWIPPFSIVISLWSVVFLEQWKRIEKSKALEWGTDQFEETEKDRAEFNGEIIKSFIDGSPMKYFPTQKKKRYENESLVVVFVLILCVVAILCGIYIGKSLLAPKVGENRAQLIASVLNATQILLTNYAYSLAAVYMTDRENHRTDTSYEDSLIAKLFCFQFINSYASFFYIGFIAFNINDCGNSCERGPMPVLAINLAIVFGSRLIGSNIAEWLAPILSNYYNRLKTSGITKSVNAVEKINESRPEKEFIQQRFTPLTVGIYDYAEMAIQFGYNTIFLTALPLACALAFISTMVEVNCDAWKMLSFYQRPIPKGVEDIGTWQAVFEMISIMAVITNAALCVFSMTTYSMYHIHTRFWIFIIFQWVCFACQYIIRMAIEDVPEEIEIQLQRRAFITRKIFDRDPDEHAPEHQENVKKYEVQFHQYPEANVKAGSRAVPLGNNENNNNNNNKNNNNELSVDGSEGLKQRRFNVYGEAKINPEIVGKLEEL